MSSGQLDIVMNEFSGGRSGESERSKAVDNRHVGCRRSQAEDDGDRVSSGEKSPMALSIRSSASLDAT